MVENFNISQFLDNFFDKNSQNLSFIFNDSCEEDKRYVMISEIVTTKIIPVLVILGLIGESTLVMSNHFSISDNLLRKCDCYCKHCEQEKDLVPSKFDCLVYL